MHIIAKHPYYKVTREVSSVEQKDVEEERYLSLYEEKISSQFRDFPIKDVFDISYRMISKGIGFLYLHTSKGVYSYKIKTPPDPFIEAFQKHIQKSSF